jgi:Rrf2 family protein
MLISQKSEYAIRALADIAANDQGRPVNRSDIASRQKIPLPYLTQVLRTLVNGGLLESSRGPSGGYSLRLAPEEVSLLDVVTLLQGPVAPAYCAAGGNDSSCDRSDGCGLVGVWTRLKDANEQVLRQTTLKDILAADGNAPGLGREASPDRKLDCVGFHCPLPIVRIAEVMMELKPGQVLEVWADDEGAKADIPAWCTGTGNDFLGREEFGDQMKFMVRKADNRVGKA